MNDSELTHAAAKLGQMERILPGLLNRLGSMIESNKAIVACMGLDYQADWLADMDGREEILRRHARKRSGHTCRDHAA